MEPFLRPGDWVAIERVGGSELKVGDVLVCGMGREWVAHRMVAKRGGRIVTRGDNRRVCDRFWTKKEVVGRVAGRKRSRGRNNEAGTYWAAGKKFITDADLKTWERPVEWVAAAVGRIGPPVPRWVVGMMQEMLVRWGWKPGRRIASPAGGRELEPIVKREARLEGAATQFEAGREAAKRTAAGDRWEVQRLGAEWAVFDTRDWSVHLLNQTAFHIWERSRAGLDKPAILGEMVAQYPEAEPSRLASDLDTALDSLKRAGLVAS